MSIILDGKKIANERKNILKEKVLKLKETKNIIPNLAIIRVGNDPASQIYVKNKIKTATEIKIAAKEYYFDDKCSEKQIIELINKLNQDELVDGILLQSPLPQNFDEEKITNLISPKKDVDGFGIQNLGYLLANEEKILAATPLGIINLLKSYQIDVAKKNVVIIGRSKIVGRPLAAILLNRDATVTIAHSKTENLKEITKNADILITAVGKPKFITSDMVKEQAICIDVGITRIGKMIIGDLDFESIKNKASYITPVPGGVGPMTIITLLENVYNIAKDRKGK